MNQLDAPVEPRMIWNGSQFIYGYMEAITVPKTPWGGEGSTIYRLVPVPVKLMNNKMAFLVSPASWRSEMQ
jgi:hypothetical protein